MVFYICTGNNPNCKQHNNGCYDCKHTTDPHYAKNGPCNNPEKYPERFEAEMFDIGKGKVVTYYWEKSQEDEANDV